MNLYRVVYSTSTGQVLNKYVSASTEDNAWVAVQSADSTAQQVESLDMIEASIVTGS